MKTPTSMRSSKLRVDTRDHDFRMDLAATHLKLHEVAAAMSRFLLTARGEPYRLRLGDKEKRVDAAEVREHLRAYCPPNVRDDAKKMAEVATLAQAFFEGATTSIPRGYCSPLYKPDSRIGDPTLARKNREGQSNEVPPCRLAARELLKLGVLPIVANDIPSAFMYAAWDMAIRHFKSYVECQKNHTDLIAGRRESLDAHLKEIDFEGMPAMASLYKEWLAFTEAHNVRPDRRFLGHWRRIRPALLQGRPISGYSPEAFPDRFAPLWDNDADRDYMADLVRMTCLESQVEMLDPEIASPSIDPALGVVAIPMGSNYIPFHFSVQDSRPCFQFELLDHRCLLGPTRKRLAKGFDGKCLTRSHLVPCWRSRYFVDLEASEIKGSSSTWRLDYLKGNRERTPISGVLREVRLLIDRRGLARGRESIEAGDLGRVHIMLPHSVDHQPNSDVFAPEDGSEFDFATPLRAAYYFATAAHKPAEKTVGSVRVGMRVMTVDLNVFPLAAYSVYELGRKPAKGEVSFAVPGFGHANPVKDAFGTIGDCQAPEFADAIRDLSRKIVAMRKVIGRFKYLVKAEQDPDALIDPPAGGALQALRHLYWPPDATASQLKELLIVDVSAVKAEYRRLRDMNVRQRGISAEHMQWILLVHELLRMLKAWTYKARPPLARGERRTRNDFHTYHDYIDHLKRDLIRKLAAEIRKAAERHRVDVLVIKDLEGFSGSKEQNRHTNDLLSVWSPSTIMGTIEQAVSVRGIPVVPVDPGFTSSVDSATDQWGYYSFEASARTLLVRRHGRIEAVDGPTNAAIGLQRKYWSRATSLYLLSCTKVEGKDERYRPKVETERLKGAVHAATGSTAALLVLDKHGAYRLEPIKPTSAKAKPGQARVPFFRWEHGWVGKQEHRDRLAAILEEFLGQVPKDDREHVLQDRYRALRDKAVESPEEGTVRESP